MPTAVIMEENFDKLLEQCEAQELEVREESRNSLFFVPTINVVFQVLYLDLVVVLLTVS